MKKIADLTWASDTHTSKRDQSRDWVLTSNATGEEVARQHGNGSIVNHIGDLESRKERITNRVYRLQADLQSAFTKLIATNDLIARAFIELGDHNDKVITNRSSRLNADEPVITSAGVAAAKQEDADADTVANDLRTVAQLRIIATDAEICGRHRMTKPQLIQAIKDAS